MKVPFLDLTRQYQSIKDEIGAAVSEVFSSGWFILGPKVEEFEETFAGYIGVKHAIGVASGTEALQLALMALGIGTGDEVILPANSYPSVFAITAVGAIPKLVDINLATFNIDPNLIEAAASPKTKAIIPVHLYGQPADISEIVEIAKKHKLFVIEDCAQAHGAKFQGQMVGTFGNIGCFSFYPTKNLGAYGDGGMIVTNSYELAEKLRKLRMYGEKARYQSTLQGINSRLDELQAAILLVKLRHLDNWNRQRREQANLYKELLKNTDLILPIESDNIFHVFHLFVIRSKERDQLRELLKENEVGTTIHYPTPIHLVPSFVSLGYKRGDFRISEQASEEVLSLPLYPELMQEELAKVVEVIKKLV